MENFIFCTVQIVLNLVGSAKNIPVLYFQTWIIWKQ